MKDTLPTNNAVMENANRPLLSIEGASLQDRTGKILSEYPVDFLIREGEHWAICGDSQYFASQLLQLVAGKIISVTGTIRRFYAQDHPNHWDKVAYMSLNHRFRNKSNVQVFYFQQRFNSVDAQEAWTVSEYLTGIPAGHQHSGRWNPETAMELFRLNDFRDEPVIKLSNGETRRLLLAAALVKNPELLILDHPLSGLDQKTREDFPYFLQQIMDSGIHIIMQTPILEIPAGITHCCLINDNRIGYAGPLSCMPDAESSEKKPERSGTDDRLQKALTALDRLIGNASVPTPESSGVLSGREPLVHMRNVYIRYGDKIVLDGIDWTVCQGEAWILSGHNGAGKSTLLSLINGDNPQAYKNEIYLFGRKRGSGESIWDIKKQIGYVSPEFHQYFPKEQTLLQVVLSGFFDTSGLFRKTTGTQQQDALTWLGMMGLDHLKNKRLSQVTIEQQRLALLARALIKKPRLLILDEPVQGLQTAQKELFKQLVETIHQKTDVALIYVSHYEEDIPDGITNRLHLIGGKIQESTTTSSITS